MRRLLSPALSLVLLPFLSAQDRPPAFPPESREQVVLYADRNMYAVEERIHFVAEYNCPPGFEYQTWSTVLYVELLRWDGRKLAGSKVEIKDGLAAGSLVIPGLARSGHYYLRAYTLWMRNFSPEQYAYLDLVVLNPHHNDLVPAPAGTAPVLRGTGGRIPDQGNNAGIRLNGFPERLVSGEAVDFSLWVPDSLADLRYHVAIGKAPSASSRMPGMDMQAYARKDAGRMAEDFRFYPEIGGLTLSGRVKNPESGQGVGDVRLQLSTYASSFFFSEERSAGDGTFFFSLPHRGAFPEFHITRASAEDYQILLAPEFCQRELQLPYMALELEGEARESARELLVNAQMAARYAPARPEGEPPGEDFPDVPFYGARANRILVEDYIELNDIGELIFEIIPQVLLKESDGETYLSVQGPGCVDFYPPLVLLDNVPVENNEQLLRIPGNRIRSIEVVNEGYVVGEQRYSGIFCIFSRHEDMAGLGSDKDQQFFNFALLDPARDMRPLPQEGIPDTRNLLLWETGLDLSRGETEGLSFRTPDVAGSYVLTVQATGHGGQAILFHHVFRVE